jgi:hypothetical protein
VKQSEIDWGDLRLALVDRTENVQDFKDVGALA